MVRLAKKEDCNQVFELMRQLSSHPFTENEFEECFRYNLENNYILVYEQFQSVLGCGILSIDYPLHFSSKRAEIVNLIVDIDARCKGIGKMLLATLEEIADEKGCVQIEVASGKQREDAHKFYFREGYSGTHYKLVKKLSVEVSNAANFSRLFGAGAVEG